MESSPNTLSLVWVCLACGQLSPHHTQPNDLIDSAAAMDLSVSPIPSFAPHNPSPPISPSAGMHTDASRTSGGVWRSPQQQQQQREGGVEGEPSRRYEDESRGSSRTDSGDDTRSAGSRHCHVRHKPRSRSHEAVDSCLNNESDSYLSMAAASQHHHRRCQQQQQLDGVHAALSGQLQRVATRDDAPPRPRTSSSYASDNSYNNSSGSRHFQHHSSHGSIAAPHPMQSLAALLMEEHLVGTREMRFCEDCHEVRCAEIRKAGEFVLHIPQVATPSATAAATLQTGSGQQQSKRPVPAERVHSAAPAVSSLLCAHETLMSATEAVKPSDVSKPPFTTRPCSAAFDAAPAPSGSSRQRDVPSVHLVVALYIARMLVKLKNAAVNIVTNFHPLSPSLPTARRSYRGDSNGDETMHGGTMDTDCVRPRDQRKEHERRRTNAPAATQPNETTATSSPHSFERAVAAAAKTQRGRVISLNSSLDEATVLGGGESNGISCNSFTTAPSQHHPQHSWHMEDCASATVEEKKEEDPLASGERGNTREVPPICMPVHAQLLFPDGGVNSSDGDSSSSSRGSGSVLHAVDACTTASPPALKPTCATADTAAVLRVSKDKWDSINVTEALWRLVLPSFSAPFLTNAAPSAQEGSNHSTPHRAAAAVAGVSQGSSRPYRGFKGEVEVAVGKLDAMQLEVAKFRLAQVLEEVVAEQARRARKSDVGY